MAREDKSKLRLIIFELEGSNDTVQESLRTIHQTFGRATLLQRHSVTMQPSLEAGEEMALPSAENETMLAGLDEDAAPAPARGRKNRKYRQPKILSIDLKAGEMPFKTYWEQKRPNENTKRYLVVSSWFREYQGVDEISIDHIYTCYRFLGLSVAKDLGQVFRDGARQGWYDPGSKRGLYAINHVGLNVVQNLR